MMKTAWLRIAVTLLALTACGQPERSADAPAAESRGVERIGEPVPPAPAVTRAPRPRIVLLGDSLTAGLGLAQEQSIPSLLQRRLDAEGHEYEVVNAGVSGDTSAGGLSRLEWSLDGDVHVLVIELGANDGLRGLPVPAMKRNLSEIIARAKRRGIKVLLTGMEAPPNYGATYTAEFRQAFRDVAREQDVAFVPFFLEGVAGLPSLNQGDGIHPNPEGAQVVARTIWESLEPLLEPAD